MIDDYIDFPGLIDYAMRDVVRKALAIAEKRGLPGEHHFFISFKTDFPGVKISRQLMEKHPQEMTIVLQHQFWDLKVSEDKFTVTLSFNNIPEHLIIPFQAMTAFADTSVKFGLQFHAFMDEDMMEELMEDEADLLEALQEEEKLAAAKTKKKKSETAASPENVVVTLDAFRKKQKPTKDKKKP